MRKVTTRDITMLVIFLLLFWGGILFMTTQYGGTDIPKSTVAENKTSPKSNTKPPKSDLSGFIPDSLHTNHDDWNNRGNKIDIKTVPLQASLTFMNTDFGDTGKESRREKTRKNKKEVGEKDNDSNSSPDPVTKANSIENRISLSPQDFAEISSFSSLLKQKDDANNPVAAKQKVPDYYNIAIILSGTPQYQQVGYGNVLIQGEDWMSYNNRWIRQYGWFNYAEQMVANTFYSDITISSNGTDNTASQNIVSTFNADVRVAQTGSYNYSNQEVYSSNKIGSLVNTENKTEQLGDFNYFDSYQTGENNHINTFQNGTSNKAKVYQEGEGNYAKISQKGSNNTVQITQN